MLSLEDVTFTVTAQVAPAASEPLLRLTVLAPALPETVPPQVEVSPVGEATTSPVGSASVKATPVSAATALVFEIDRVRVDTPPGTILVGENDLVMAGAATIVRVAV